MDTVVVKAKAWWKSRTVWANILGVTIAFIEQIMAVFTDSGIQVPDGFTEFMLGALGVGNVILRFITSGPVTAGMKDKPMEVALK